MNKRESLSNGVRFEVFKRDGFKCQYCGRSAPDVILHVDHIKPVATGGKNEIFNLITSCKECNTGKGKKELHDKTILEKQRKQLEELEERRNQLKMMIDWRDEITKFNDDNAEYVHSYFKKVTGYHLNDAQQLKFLLKRFTPIELCEGIDAGMVTYCEGSMYARASKIISVLGGICYNRRKNAEAERNGNTTIH